MNGKENEKRIESMRETHYTLAEEAMDMVIGDVGDEFDKEIFTSKLEASKHGMNIVNNFEIMKRITAGANIRIINMYPEEEKIKLVKEVLPLLSEK